MEKRHCLSFRHVLESVEEATSSNELTAYISCTVEYLLSTFATSPKYSPRARAMNKMTPF